MSTNLNFSIKNLQNRKKKRIYIQCDKKNQPSTDLYRKDKNTTNKWKKSTKTDSISQSGQQSFIIRTKISTQSGLNTPIQHQ